MNEIKIGDVARVNNYCFSVGYDARIAPQQIFVVQEIVGDGINSRFRLLDKSSNIWNLDSCELYQTEVQYLKSRLITTNRLLHNAIVRDQAALVAAKAVDATMGIVWIQTGLMDSGFDHCTESDDPNQFYADNQLDCFLICDCGKPAAVVVSESECHCGDSACAPAKGEGAQ